MIRFENVTLRFGEEQVLDDLSFELEPGSKTVLEGPSGSGKTSILRLCMGFQQPNQGNIYFNDELLNAESISNIRKQIAWLPQDAQVGMGSVRDVLNFPFTFKSNESEAPTDDSLKDLLSQMALNNGILDKSFRDLSGGQKQRIGIALCLLLNRPLFLLDEPTASLDPASKRKVMNLLFSNPDRTILSTSHDPEWVEQTDNVIHLA